MGVVQQCLQPEDETSTLTRSPFLQLALASVIVCSLVYQVSPPLTLQAHLSPSRPTSHPPGQSLTLQANLSPSRPISHPSGWLDRLCAAAVLVHEGNNLITLEGMQPTLRHVPPSVGFFSTHTVCRQTFENVQSYMYIHVHTHTHTHTYTWVNQHVA